MRTYKTIEKIRQRYYWPGFKEDVKKHIRCCDRCQKRAGLPWTHRQSLTDWAVSYPFHHIGLDFFGPLPMSNNCQFVLLIGDHSTKWYEAFHCLINELKPQPTLLLNHWICRFGCPRSIHTDQGRNSESDFFPTINATIRDQQNSDYVLPSPVNGVIERMNRTLLNMLSKCLDQNQSDWSTLLPFVSMAYRSSVYESTGFTPYILVFGHGMSLPLDLMYQSPEHSEPSFLYKQLLERQEAIRKAIELVRRNATAQQLRRSALYNRKVHGPVYKDGDCVFLHYPVTAPGCSSKLFSHWRGPYRIIKFLKDVNYTIKKIGNGKQLVVHYDRLKRYHGVVAPKSIIPERNPSTKIVPTSKQSKQFDHSHCEYITFPTTLFLPCVPPKPFYRPQPIATPIPVSPRGPLPPEFLPTPSAPLSSHDSFIESTLLACSSSTSGKLLLSGTTPKESSTPASGRRGIQSGELPPSTPPGSSGDEASYIHSTPASSSNPLDSVIAGGASRHLHDRLLREPPPSSTRKLRAINVAQRKAEPLCKDRLPPNFTAFFSPRKFSPKTAIEPGSSNPH